MFKTETLYDIIRHRDSLETQSNRESIFNDDEKRVSISYPISAEQNRRFSRSSSTISPIIILDSGINFPSGIAIPNSIIRRKSLSDKEENNNDRRESLRECLQKMSTKELEERILRRLLRENVVKDDSIANEPIETSNLITRIRVMEQKKRMPKKMKLDKEREMKRILRRTSTMTPFDEKHDTTETIKRAIRNSESINKLLTEPEKFIKKEINTTDAEKPPATLTHSWIRRVSESLQESSKRISELSEKITAKMSSSTSFSKQETINKSKTPVTKQKKKEKIVKKKSSLKISKLVSSSHTHPTIPEGNEKDIRCSDSRQTQMSVSSLRSARISLRSSGSVSQRPSTTTGSLKQVKSGNMKPVSRKESPIKKAGSLTSEKLLRSSHSSSNSVKGDISQRSSASRKQSDKSLKKVKPTSSTGSKQRSDTQVSRTSSRGKSSEGRSVSTSSSANEEPRTSLASLIDLYYASPARQSTSETLKEYTKAIFGKKAKERLALNKMLSRPQSSTMSSNHPSDTDESSYIIKRDTDTEDNDERRTDICSIPSSAGKDIKKRMLNQKKDLIANEANRRHSLKSQLSPGRKRKLSSAKRRTSSAKESSDQSVNQIECNRSRSQSLKESIKAMAQFKNRRVSKTQRTSDIKKKNNSPRASIKRSTQEKKLSLNKERRQSSDSRRRSSSQKTAKPKKITSDISKDDASFLSLIDVDKSSQNLVTTTNNSPNKKRKSLTDKGTNVLSKSNETLKYLTKKKVISLSLQNGKRMSNGKKQSTEKS